MLGEAQRHEFQAETRQLLDIVAKTLYSEKEVWNKDWDSNPLIYYNYDHINVIITLMWSRGLFVYK